MPDWVVMLVAGLLGNLLVGALGVWVGVKVLAVRIDHIAERLGELRSDFLVLLKRFNKHVESRT